MHWAGRSGRRVVGRPRRVWGALCGAAAFALGLAVGPASSMDGVGDVKVVFTGLENDEGRALFHLMYSKQDFETENRERSHFAAVAVEGKRASYVFRNVAHGEIAVKAFHDENLNEKLDTNLVGIPKESFGFSNNATGRFGPPGYEDCKLLHDTPERTVEILATRF